MRIRVFRSSLFSMGLTGRAKVFVRERSDLLMVAVREWRAGMKALKGLDGVISSIAVAPGRVRCPALEHTVVPRHDRNSD
jgi:hypothetical protein